MELASGATVGNALEEFQRKIAISNDRDCAEDAVVVKRCAAFGYVAGGPADFPGWLGNLHSDQVRKWFLRSGQADLYQSDLPKVER